MKYLVITNCTNRKSLKPHSELGHIPLFKKATDLEKVAKKWANSIKTSQNKICAEKLYQGRSIQDTRTTADILKSDIFVISAGLGLVNFKEQIPSYELSVAKNSPFNKKLIELDIPITKWWSSINKARIGNSNPLSEIINSGKYSKVFIATSSAYLDLIADDLWSAQPRYLKNVLIFTSTLGQQRVPPCWNTQIAPYDERFEDKRIGYSGTRVDFPQRTLRHFVEKLKLQDESFDLIRLEITKLIQKSSKPILPKRRKITDEEVIKLIKKNWKSQLGSSQKLLRYLRDIELVSCEQSRFTKLWNHNIWELNEKNTK
jgi:hypothetical protein